jgi:chemotaxis signal transduction protein
VVGEGRRGGWFVLEAPGSRPLALPVDLIGRLEPVTSWIPVPNAPAGVVGLAEVRGRPTTLLDPAVWTGAPTASPAAPAGALLLAAPRDHLALARWARGRTIPWEPGRALPRQAAVVDGEALERALSELARPGGAA